uniref:Uncharacterized protein n=1 Tax=Trametes gibbosa TaxID=160864 RepID=A0A6G6FQF6_9APHY|nr:hypothetical protein [Trametes gibbosa]
MRRSRQHCCPGWRTSTPNSCSSSCSRRRRSRRAGCSRGSGRRRHRRRGRTGPSTVRRDGGDRTQSSTEAITIRTCRAAQAGVPSPAGGGERTAGVSGGAAAAAAAAAGGPGGGAGEARRCGGGAGARGLIEIQSENHAVSFRQEDASTAINATTATSRSTTTSSPPAPPAAEAACVYYSNTCLSHTIVMQSMAHVPYVLDISREICTTRLWRGTPSPWART